MAKILTIFYSLKGETIAPGMKIVNLEKGIPLRLPGLSKRLWAAHF